MQSSEVIVLIQTQTLPESADEAKEALLDLAREVLRVERDCLGIELAQNTDDPAKITMIEKWSSREAYEGPHMQSQHMQAFIEASAKLFAGPPSMSFWRGTSVDAS